MTTRRRVLLTSIAATAWPASVIAQGNIPVAGLLWLEPSPFRKQLVDALRERGYVENQNIRMLDRTTTEGYGQLANNARELVSAKVDVIVAYGNTAAVAAATATREISVIVLAGNARDIAARVGQRCSPSSLDGIVTC